MGIKYYSFGSESEKEGLTIGANYEEEASGIFIGTPKDKPWYKQKEITKEEYDAYAARMNDPNEPRGFYGLVNEKGKAAAEKAMALYNEKITSEDAALVTYLKDKLTKLFTEDAQAKANFSTVFEAETAAITFHSSTAKDDLKADLVKALGIKTNK